MKPNMDKTGRLVRAFRVLAVPALVLLAATGCNSKSGSGGGNPNSPLLASVEPAVGPFGGGTEITIRGENFLFPGAGVNAVLIGGRPAASVITVDDTTILATTPDGTPGMAVDVSVSNTMGLGRLFRGFSYLTPAPVLSDMNGDGVADMVVGAPQMDSNGTNSGSVFIFFGSDQPGALTDMTSDDADIVLTGEAAGDHFGLALTAGDVDGDGQDDLVIGAHLHDGVATDSGAVYIFHGPLTDSTILASTADVRIDGEPIAGERFGNTVACGDLDGSGVADVIVGASRHDVPTPTGALIDAGCVYVFEGGPGMSSMPATSAYYALDGTGPGDRLGNAIGCGDVDGDGLGDLLVAACLKDVAGPPLMRDAGSVYVLCARNGLTGRTLDDADMRIDGEAVNDEFGTSLTIGDIDGDGLADVVAGTPLNDSLGTNVGRVYIFHGNAAVSDRGASDADVFLTGQPTNDTFGMALTVGDMNGDGLEDVICGAPMASFTHNSSGRAFVYLGQQGGMRDRVATTADVIYNGEPFADDRCGALVRVADVNSDGMADVLVAAPGNDAGGPGAGRVYLFLGEQGITGQRNATDDDVTLTGAEAGGMFGSAVADGQ
jgi:hypothetical protein